MASKTLLLSVISRFVPLTKVIVTACGTAAAIGARRRGRHVGWLELRIDQVEGCSEGVHEGEADGGGDQRIGCGHLGPRRIGLAADMCWGRVPIFMRGRGDQEDFPRLAQCYDSPTNRSVAVYDGYQRRCCSMVN